jgi:hypothetical protein
VSIEPKKEKDKTSVKQLKEELRKLNKDLNQSTIKSEDLNYTKLYEIGTQEKTDNLPNDNLVSKKRKNKITIYLNGVLNFCKTKNFILFSKLDQGGLQEKIRNNTNDHQDTYSDDTNRIDFSRYATSNPIHQSHTINSNQSKYEFIRHFSSIFINLVPIINNGNIESKWVLRGGELVLDLSHLPLETEIEQRTRLGGQSDDNFDRFLSLRDTNSAARNRGNRYNTNTNESHDYG